MPIWKGSSQARVITAHSDQGTRRFSVLAYGTTPQDALALVQELALAQNKYPLYRAFNITR